MFSKGNKSFIYYFRVENWFISKIKSLKEPQKSTGGYIINHICGLRPHTLSSGKSKYFLLIFPLTLYKSLTNVEIALSCPSLQTIQFVMISIHLRCLNSQSGCSGASQGGPGGGERLWESLLDSPLD